MSQVGALARWTDHEASIIVFNNDAAPAHISIAPHNLPFPWETSPGPAMTEETWLLTPAGITRLPAADLEATLPALSAMIIMRSVGV